MPTVTLVLPIEWAEAYDQRYDENPIDYDRFESNGFQDFVRDHRDWAFHSFTSDFVTTEHDTPGYEGDELVCARVTFLVPAGTSPPRRTVARELRISVPAPTKLPLP